MEYRIVVDSCGELTDEMKKSGIYKTASLSMEMVSIFRMMNLLIRQIS